MEEEKVDVAKPQDNAKAFVRNLLIDFVKEYSHQARNGLLSAEKTNEEQASIPAGE